MFAAKGSRIQGHLKALAIDNLYFRKALKAKKLYGSLSLDRKNEANKMFIIWLLSVWGTGNKCRTRDLTIISQASRKKVFIGSRKQ